MPFCTTCGANVTGAFCNQCGTPASAAAAAQPVPPPASTFAPPASGYAQPAPPPAGGYAQPVTQVGAPLARRTSPIVWILIIVVGLFVLGGIGVVSVIALVAHRARQAGLAFETGRDGGFSMKARGADGKDARMEFGTKGGKMPSWVPAYPGAENQPTFSIKASGDGGGEGGNVSFTTTDSPARVKEFYKEKCKDLGMKVNLETTSGEGSMMIFTDEGEKHSLTILVVPGEAGQTTINVTYGFK